MRDLQDRYEGRAVAARLRINGRAETDESAAALAEQHSAKRLVGVTANHIFTNCPRYIPKSALQERSIYTPRKGHSPPGPTWKSRSFVRDNFDEEGDRSNEK
jgi:hypothetical protein